MRKGLFLLLSLIFSLSATAADPTATHYSYQECQGSALPYPTPDMALRAIPDSLTPVYVNHVGRHGARFLSSSKYTTALLRHLHKADSLRTITPAGRSLMTLCHTVVAHAQPDAGEHSTRSACRTARHSVATAHAHSATVS